MAAPPKVERLRRTTDTLRATLFERAGRHALNGVELTRRGDEKAASTAFERAMTGYRLARTVTLFEEEIHEAELDKVQLLRPQKERHPKPPKEPREREAYKILLQNNLRLGKHTLILMKLVPILPIRDLLMLR